MKTIEHLESEIQVLKNNVEAHVKNGELKEKAQCLDRINYLTYCISYLSSNPTQQFIDKEIMRLRTTIEEKQKVIDDYFLRESFQKMQKSEFSKLVKNKETQYGLPNFRKQLENLLFINS